MAKSFGIDFLIGAKVGGTVASAFQSLDTRLQNTRQALARANQDAKALSKTLELREKRDAMKSKIKAGGADPAMLESYRRLNRAYMDAAKSAGVFGQGLDALKNRERQARESVNQLTQSLERNQKMVARRDAMMAESQKRSAAVMGLWSTGLSAMAMAAPLKVGLDFEEAMSKVRAISGATGDTFAALEKQARELGATTVWSAKEAAEGMSFLSMAGFNAEQTMAAMPGLLSLASAGAMDLGSTADIASNILSGFGFQADKMNYVSDVMAKTFTRSNTSISSLGEAMKYCAPVAAQSGQSFQDLAAMIGKLGDAGIQGSMAGTGLSAIIGRLAAPPKAAATAMKQLGIEIADADGKMRPMPDVFAEIAKKTANMGEEQKVAYAKALFGANHFAKGLVLMEAAGKGTLQELSAGLYEEGYATKVAQDQTNNFSGDLKALNSATEEVSISIFNAVNPALRTITKGVTSCMQAFGGWVNQHPQVAQGLFLIGGALTALKIGSVVFTLLRSGATSFGLGIAQMGAMAKAPLSGIKTGLVAVGRAFLTPWNFSGNVAIVRQGAASMKSSLASLRSTISGTIAKMRELGPAGMTAATMNMTASGMARASRAGWNVLKMGVRGVGAAFKVAFGPMSLLVTGLSMAADYIIENWDSIKPFFVGLWEGVKNIFNKAMEWIQPMIDMVGGALDKIGAAWDWLFGSGEDDKKGKAEADAKKVAAEIEKQGAKKEETPQASHVPTLAERQKMSEMADQLAQEDAEENDEMPAELPPPKQKKPKKDFAADVAESASAPQTGKGGGDEGGGVNVEVAINVTQNGVPDQEFAQGVINAIKSRQAEFESIISNLVQQQARLAYGG